MKIDRNIVKLSFLGFLGSTVLLEAAIRLAGG